jgi:endonuclease/exonuclease/phosphatase family metal-dependent hydrolase
MILLCRILTLFLNTRGKMFASGVGAACFLLFLPAFLSSQSYGVKTWFMGLSLCLGVTGAILDRTFRSGVDLSMIHGFKTSDLIFGFLIVLGLAQAIPSLRASQRASSTEHSETYRPQPLKIIGLSLGIAACLVLMYFTFTSPTVITRWTGDSYLLILSVLLLALIAFVVGLAWKPTLLEGIHPFVLLAWNGLFILCLTLTLLAHQVKFPSSPTGYPFATTPQPWHTIPLVLMLLLAPVILVDFSHFCQQIITEKPSVRLLGVSFAIGSLFILVMIFAQVFTTVYDYIPMVGPLFRDRFWLVFLANGVVLTLPVLLLRKNTGAKNDESSDKPFLLRLAGFITFSAIVAILSTLLTSPRSSTSTGQNGVTIRVLTFNIQQGYSQDGQINPDGQLSIIRSLQPDVVGLQETDIARVSGGNADVVRYFADGLEMFSYYGPSTVAGTFGIALLSRYPIHNTRTYYLYSLGEQTAVIEAQITVGEKTYHIYVTHLGNDGPIVQQEQVLQLVQGKENVLLMGDFNFRPDTDQYRLTTGTLEDAWLLRPPQNPAIQRFDPNTRIDYLYVSPGMKIVESEYIEGTESDHPVLITEIEP